MGANHSGTIEIETPTDQVRSMPTNKQDVNVEQGLVRTIEGSIGHRSCFTQIISFLVATMRSFIKVVLLPIAWLSLGHALSANTTDNTTSPIGVTPEPFDFQQTIGSRTFRFSGSCQTDLFWHSRKSSEALTTVIEALEDAGSRVMTPQERVRWNLQDISLIVSAPTSGDRPLRAEDASTLLLPLYDFLRDQDPRLDSHPCTGKIEDQYSTRIDFAYQKMPYTEGIVDITPALHVTAVERPDLPIPQNLVEQLLANTAAYLASPQFDPAALVPNTQEFGTSSGTSHLTWEWTINSGAPNRLTWAQSKTVLNSITAYFRQKGWRYADIIVQTGATGGWTAVAEIMVFPSAGTDLTGSGNSSTLSSVPIGLNGSVPLALNVSGSVGTDVQTS
ncbi:MAG: hypothetical protein OHK93_004834 [Ramalina farinacea]|uniref:Uncharacterized protein n=1 Tax=Ramalina farinacea TaxID=258253 RepID=A0AA43U0P2_9LECA|nr:hypothetical protein [Ramalina farinacea]